MSWDCDHGDCESERQALRAQLDALVECLDAHGIDLSEEARGIQREYRMTERGPVPIPFPFEPGGRFYRGDAL